MVQGMMVGGKMIKQVDGVVQYKLRAVYTKVSGKPTKLMDTEFINIPMEIDMKDIGKKINNMEKEQKSGLISLNIKVIM